MPKSHSKSNLFSTRKTKSKRTLKHKPVRNRVAKVKLIFLCEMGIIRSPTIANLFTTYLKEKKLDHVFQVESGSAYFASKSAQGITGKDVVVVLGADLDKNLKTPQAYKIVFPKLESKKIKQYFAHILSNVTKKFTLNL